MDWAAYLENLQAVLKEFDPVAAPSEEILIYCFQEGFRPSIQAQIDSWHWELDLWDEMLDKAIEAESKAALQSSTIIQEMDACCWKERRPDKKEETSKFYKEEKPKPADNQPTTSTQASGRNSCRTRGNRRDRQPGRSAPDTPAPRVQTWLILLLTTLAGTGIGPKRTLVKSLVGTATKRALIWLSAPKLPSQKTSFGLGNLLVGDWG